MPIIYLVVDISVMRAAGPTDTEIARLCYAIVKTIHETPEFGLAMCKELWNEYLKTRPVTDAERVVSPIN